jgi:DNA-binding CsgD family transcriptional regulator
MRSSASSVIINDDWEPKAGCIFEFGADQKYLRLFFDRHAAADPRPLHEQRLAIGFPMPLKALYDDERHAQEFFQDFVQAQGFGDLLAVQLLRSGRRVGWLSTARSGIQPRYGEQERRAMSLLSPHLCQALAVSDAIDLATLTAYRLEQTVNALSAGVFLTDRQGRIVYMNKSAERQVTTGNALRVANRRLTATDRKADELLARALGASVEIAPGPTATGGVFALPDGGAAGYLASVLPLDGGTRRTLMAPFRARTAVFVQDPTAAPRTEGEAFARLYGLSAAEFKVLLTLAPGLTAKEAAAALGLREPTIKTHLQRIYVKTGMSRQAEVVRLLLAHVPPLRNS